MSDKPNLRPLTEIEFATVRAAIESILQTLEKKEPGLTIGLDQLPGGVRVMDELKRLAELFKHSSLILAENIPAKAIANTHVAEVSPEQFKQLGELIEPMDFIDDDRNPFEGL